jgi:hypothetical protein
VIGLVLVVMAVRRGRRTDALPRPATAA